MGDILVLWFFSNTLVFCWIFWILTFIGEYFYKKNSQPYKNQFYECGFLITNDIDIQIHFNFLLLAGFLIIYDIEFMFLLPFIFNVYYVSFIHFITLFLFLFLFLFSLFYDWNIKALNWQI